MRSRILRPLHGLKASLPRYFSHPFVQTETGETSPTRAAAGANDVGDPFSAAQQQVGLNGFLKTTMKEDPEGVWAAVWYQMISPRSRRGAQTSHV